MSHTQTECENYLGIFCGLLSVPHYIVMDLNNVMWAIKHPLLLLSTILTRWITMCRESVATTTRGSFTTH